MVFYYNSLHGDAPELLSHQLSQFISPEILGSRQIVILCIGSDRSTGDSLGPLIGYKLSKHTLNNVSIHGTLSSPVHAANLEYTIELINEQYDNPYIIAIDASLGKKDHIGCVTLGTGALKPGLGVKKRLPEVGNIHITGIVDFSGMMDTVLLQTTRLCTIMTLADVISKAIIDTFKYTSALEAS